MTRNAPRHSTTFHHPLFYVNVSTSHPDALDPRPNETTHEVFPARSCHRHAELPKTRPDLVSRNEDASGCGVSEAGPLHHTTWDPMWQSRQKTPLGSPVLDRHETMKRAYWADYASNMKAIHNWPASGNFHCRKAPVCRRKHAAQSGSCSCCFILPSSRLFLLSLLYCYSFSAYYTRYTGFIANH